MDKKHAKGNICLIKFPQNLVKISTLTKKLEKIKIKQKQTKTKANWPNQKGIFY